MEEAAKDPEAATPSPAEDGVDMGPYGPRGKDTPPLVSMLGGYGIIFGAAVLLPLLLFVLVRFVLL